MDDHRAFRQRGEVPAVGQYMRVVPLGAGRMADAVEVRVGPGRTR